MAVNIRYPEYPLSRTFPTGAPVFQGRSLLNLVSQHPGRRMGLIPAPYRALTNFLTKETFEKIQYKCIPFLSFVCFETVSRVIKKGCPPSCGLSAKD